MKRKKENEHRDFTTVLKFYELSEAKRVSIVTPAQSPLCYCGELNDCCLGNWWYNVLIIIRQDWTGQFIYDEGHTLFLATGSWLSQLERLLWPGSVPKTHRPSAIYTSACGVTRGYGRGPRDTETLDESSCLSVFGLNWARPSLKHTG